MADAMVTARMSQEKKEAGNRVLEQLGTNATQEEIAEAIAWVDSIPRKDRFSTMTDDEIRRERLVSRGLATSKDFS